MLASIGGINADVADLTVEPQFLLPSVGLNKGLATDVKSAPEAPKPAGISVAYAGVGHDGIDFLRFIVHNGTPKDVVYAAKVSDLPVPEVTVNNVPVPDKYRCGSGLRLYRIAPGASAEFHVLPYEFETSTPKNALVSVGFYMFQDKPELAETKVSQPFPLPPRFRSAIMRWHREAAKQFSE
jgi:hypothetical protein